VLIERNRVGCWEKVNGGEGGPGKENGRWRAGSAA
jgi:hypothetical protein